MRVLLAIFIFAATGWAQSATYLLVLNKSSNSLSFVNLESMRSEATVSVGQQPHEIAVSPDGRKAYVSNFGAHTISVVDLKARREIRQIRSQQLRFPHGLAFTGDAGRAIVTSEQRQKILFIDPSRDEIVNVIDTDQEGTHMVALSPDSGWAYFTNRVSNTVSVLDVNSAAIVSNVVAGDGVEGIALSPDGRQLWVANRNEDTVTVFNAGTQERIAELPAGRGPLRVAFSPDGRRAFVPAGGSAELLVYDTATRRQLKAIAVGANPSGVTVSPDGRSVFVACAGSNDVHVIDTGSLSVRRKIAVERGPDGMAVWQAQP